MILQFQKQDAFHLAMVVLTQPMNPWNAQIMEDERKVDISETLIGELLERYEQQDAAVIPILAEQCDRWYVVGKDRHSADQAFSRVSHFVLPTYGTLPENSIFSSFRRFESTDSPILALASTHYAGYHLWLSSPYFRRQILSGLATAFQLDQRRPLLKPPQRKSYAELYAQFNSQLAAANWGDAERTLAEIRTLHLATAETHVFLTIQLLAMQHRWNEIWKSDSYTFLANMSLPRSVRSALITAFHHSVLLEWENQDAIESALDRFRSQQPRLGVLLSGRFELPESPVIRVFGYQAVLSQDRQTLETLLADANLDNAAKQCLLVLSKLLPPTQRPQLSAKERLQMAMDERNYDAAIQAASDMSQLTERVGALLQVAIRHADARQPAYQAFLQLSEELQSQLFADDPVTRLCLNAIEADLQPKIRAITTWHEWFQGLHNGLEGRLLWESLDQLESIDDERHWNLTTLAEVAEKLNLIAYENTALFSRRHVKRAIQSLIDIFLKDQQFPQSATAYVELYEALYACLVFAREVNSDNSTKLLRLAEAILRQNGTKLQSISQDIKDWFNRPSSSQENSVLDALDLLIEYGATQTEMMEWFRNWLAKLLNRPNHLRWERANQEVWLSIGEWLVPGDGLLNLLHGSLEREIEQEGEDPLLRLQEGFRIGIFTLRKSSAERTRSILLKRNPDLKIQICTETDLNEPAKALASHCDVAVIVTTCMTHALTYGIRPFLQADPIYPDSQGSSSIVRSVENYARNLLS